MTHRGQRQLWLRWEAAPARPLERASSRWAQQNEPADESYLNRAPPLATFISVTLATHTLAASMRNTPHT